MIADRVRLAIARLASRCVESQPLWTGGHRPAIGKYQQGESVPSSSVLVAFSRALGVSLTYLMDTQGLEVEGVEFRTKASTTARHRAYVETEVLEWIERYLRVPSVSELESAEWQCPVEGPGELRQVSDSEQVAVEVRVEWHLGTGPIPNISELLEEEGLKF